MKGIIALRMCDMSKYGGLPLEYGTVPAPVWRNIHPRLRMGTAARARAGVGNFNATVTCHVLARLAAQCIAQATIAHAALR